MRLPGILYHQRSIESSLADAPPASLYAFQAGVRAVADHLSFIAPGSRVVPSFKAPGLNSVILPLPKEPPLVSILIPSGGGYELLNACIASILSKTSYPNFEILVDNGSVDPNVIQHLRDLESQGLVRVIRYERPSDETFNYSRLINQLTKHARGDVLLFLNDDTEVLEGEWLSDMVSILLLPGVGVVGAHLLYPDMTIQHAGVAIGSWYGAALLYSRVPDGSHGYFGDLQIIRNVSAVIGACQAISKAHFEQVVGMDE
jgi:GT2 family glycosyltransferase